MKFLIQLISGYCRGEILLRVPFLSLSQLTKPPADECRPEPVNNSIPHLGSCPRLFSQTRGVSRRNFVPGRREDRTAPEHGKLMEVLDRYLKIRGHHALVGNLLCFSSAAHCSDLTATNRNRARIPSGKRATSAHGRIASNPTLIYGLWGICGERAPAFSLNFLHDRMLGSATQRWRSFRMTKDIGDNTSIIVGSTGATGRSRRTKTWRPGWRSRQAAMKLRDGC